nr:hypothetical protein [Tanacetum cinerariifolium]
MDEQAAKAFNESDIIQFVFDSGILATSCIFNLPIWEVKNIIFRKINHHQDIVSVFQNSITFPHKRLQEEEVMMIGRDREASYLGDPSYRFLIVSFDMNWS